MRLLCAHYAHTTTSKTPNRKNKNKRPIWAQPSGKIRKIAKLFLSLARTKIKQVSFTTKKDNELFQNRVVA